MTNGELLFLRTRQPYLVGEAIAHILRGSLNRAVMAGLLAAFMLAALWIVAASLGRIATVRGLLEYFRRDAGNTSTGPVRVTVRETLPATSLRMTFATVATRYSQLRALASTFCAPPWP